MAIQKLEEFKTVIVEVLKGATKNEQLEELVHLLKMQHEYFNTVRPRKHIKFERRHFQMSLKRCFVRLTVYNQWPPRYSDEQ